MPKPIFPCLWFDRNAQDAAAFYCSIFPDGRILNQNPMVTTWEMAGSKMMGLNGGPIYKQTSAVSFFVYCDDQAEVRRLYEALSEGGKPMMELGKYEWSELYAWVEDRFGVNWQITFDSIRSPQKVVPTLLFSNEKRKDVRAAFDLYTSTIPNSTILFEAPYGPNVPDMEGALLFGQVKLNGFILNAISSTGHHDFDFTPGNSFVIECETQEEIDHFWEKLGEGGHYHMCGWLADRFGVSWQIVPAVLGELMEDPERRPRVVEAFMKMQKFDLHTLLNA